jgi:hypothetical protein
LQTFENETRKPLSFGNFVKHHDYEPELLLVKETWTGWKVKQIPAVVVRVCPHRIRIRILENSLEKTTNVDPDNLIECHGINNQSN